MPEKAVTSCFISMDNDEQKWILDITPATWIAAGCHGLHWRDTRD